MPWTETTPMNEKMKFIVAHLKNEDESFQSLCMRFNISCKTGYKYVNRFNSEGSDGLKERSRAPHSQSRQMPEYIEESILELKNRYPHWGSKKLLNWLLQERKEEPWPARSTIDDLLKRNNLVRPAKRKRRVIPYKEPLVLCTSANKCWSIDYKGQFRLGDKTLCYPLTVTDNFSRFLFAVDGRSAISGRRAKAVLKKLFLEFGLPDAIRSDNGSPFAGNGLGGLSQLAVWLIRLGIVPERIRKGHPEENGRHERMHLTLKQETASPPQWDLTAQQRSFDNFRVLFNEERPHEAIEFNRPARIYTPSPKMFPNNIPNVEYDSNYLNTRRIRTNGTMKWKGDELFVSESLIGETIGMKPNNEDEWTLFYSFMPIGIFNEKERKVRKL